MSDDDYNFLIDGNDDEQYISDSEGNHIYPDRAFPFAKRRDGTFHYAETADGDEYYPFDAEDYPIFKPVSEHDSALTYAKNTRGDEYYPVDPATGKEVFITVGHRPVYAKTLFGDEILPKGVRGEEREIGGIKALDRYGFVIYPHGADGFPVYPLDASGNEFYGTGLGSKVLFGKHRDTGSEVYARKSNGDEFYPRPLSFAFDERRDTFLYAADRSGQMIFPIDDNGNELYVRDDRTGTHVTTLPDGRPISRYARTKTVNGKFIEIYPTAPVPGGEGHGSYEVALESLGYRTMFGKMRYPLDEYGNEYVIPVRGASEWYPNGYPVTWDHRPIVRGDEATGRPILNPNDPSVKKEHLTHNIGRHVSGFRDFVSSRKEPTRHPLPRGKDYETRKAVVEWRDDETFKFGMILLGGALILLGIMLTSFLG